LEDTFDISRYVAEFLEFIVLSSFFPLICKTRVSKEKLTRRLEVGGGIIKEKKQYESRGFHGDGDFYF
jgi:hypothetical protein